MKSKLFKTLALGLIAVSLWSCKKEETRTVSNVTAAGTLTASTIALNLIQANGALPATTLTYPLATSSGYVVPVNTTLQFALKGTNFATPKEVVVTTKSYAPTITEVNNMILAFGGLVGKPAEVEVRLKSGAAVNDLTYSNVVTLTATPYLASAWIYAPGAYQGWNPSTADSLISLSSNGVYTGMIAYTTGNLEFKITPAKKWDVAYGDAGGGKISSSAGDNLKSPDAIVKQVTVDLNKNTIVFGTPNEWSIIGDATPGGWNNDTDMKGVNDGKFTVYSIKTTLGVGEFKFRFGHAWDVNLGGGATLTTGGDNIKVTAAGNYTITLTVIKTGDKVTGGIYTIVKN
ncbi:SusF/SusE family outer membrane protein [Pedobacter sp. MC2016-05]|uniref:SusE domain-containing protein n=1 Tax=Pedobacter sp. MC2016-05 TaxID=2994474 RepID=UPI0022459CB6|nr:SusF/SusE family outer membrane protein [Pedobacter sp. MC2016-05]MCX2475787.1 SusF/SusE family outer membrane protein [Pedobacter sp. MC2016-05]